MTAPAGARARAAAGVQHRPPGRGRYFTLPQAVEAYPVFTVRLLRRLVEQRRIAFSRVGRCIILSEDDIEAYIDAQRVEPPAPSPWEAQGWSTTGPGVAAGS